MRKKPPSDILAALQREGAAHLPAAKRADAEIRALAAGMPRTFFALGSALTTLRASRHHLYLGHHAFDAYLRAVGLKKSTAYKALSIVEHLPKLRAVALGFERAYAVSRHVAGDPKAARDRSLDMRSARSLMRVVDAKRDERARALLSAFEARGISARIVQRATGDLIAVPLDVAEELLRGRPRRIRNVIPSEPRRVS